MAASKALIKAVKKYNDKTYKKIIVRIRKDNTPVINKLESVGSKNGYIIGLIEKDIQGS